MCWLHASQRLYGEIRSMILIFNDHKARIRMLDARLSDYCRAGVKTTRNVDEKILEKKILLEFLLLSRDFVSDWCFERIWPQWEFQQLHRSTVIVKKEKKKKLAPRPVSNKARAQKFFNYHFCGSISLNTSRACVCEKQFFSVETPRRRRCVLVKST